ncbi:MAG: hypothetical protein P1P76_04215 [Anaerolineales bacterium]|nr:hypothetical protein [Anaerolineales bacterium]
MSENLPRQRIPLILMGLLALLVAMWAGLIRLGWAFPAGPAAWARYHGPLMVSGFLGTVIALERAAAIGRRWTYLAPALSGLGGLALVLGLPHPVGPALITAGSLGLLAVFADILRRHQALYLFTMAIGAVAWLMGNALWLVGWPVARVVLLWAGFLILTVLGERLELSRVLRPGRQAQAVFAGAVALFTAGIVVSIADFDLGWRLTGVGMIALVFWLARFDVARRTIRKPGLTRFIAVCLLCGYFWLAVGGLLAISDGAVIAGPRYDAFLHAVFLGFVFSMIFGHAPMILPAVLGIPVAYWRGLYAHLILLQVSLLMRVPADLAGWENLRRWGGMLNVIALLLFLLVTAITARRGQSASARGQG